MLDNYFNFKDREKELYALWENAGIFKPESAKDQNAPVFNITMPPPNANGELHLGHAFGYTVMDILGRYHRLIGERVLLLPGKDHAGIQTQVVFEKKLRAEGVDVDSMSRDEFFERCYAFCMDRAGYMRAQEKELGVSADWSREVFTLDPKVSEIVYDTFKRMWNDGLVYRGNRIVHWSVLSQTAISDIEVDYKETDGHLWHIQYPHVSAVKSPARKLVPFETAGLSEIQKVENYHVVVGDEGHVNLDPGHVLIVQSEDEETEDERYVVCYEITITPEEDLTEKLKKFSNETREWVEKLNRPCILYVLLPDLDLSSHITVATTRPETMLGDTAIAVHPNDPRYAHLIGSSVRIPIQNREIVIIADDRVEMNFGTGAVKITPAHDFLDFDIGETHGLQKRMVIDKHGKMTHLAGDAYEGMTTLDCRAKLVEDLKEQGFLVKTEKMRHKVPIAERGKDIIEPLISEQWFVNIDKEGKSLRKKALKFIQDDKINIVPARMKRLFEVWLENLRDWNISRQITWGHRMPVWYNKADRKDIHVGTEAPEIGEWEQETDTFDTWFSSGQWAFSTLKVNDMIDLENPDPRHFPTHTMQMGKDILFFWACRMLLFAAYRLDNIPWKNIYFTGLVRDKNGEKMSKSKGNGVEPRKIIDDYGTDGLRLGLVVGSSPGNDIRWNDQKTKGYAAFINKLWNAAKFSAIHLTGFDAPRLTDFSNLQFENSKWILRELDAVKESVTRNLGNYDLAPAFDELYNFTWSVFCDWFLEIVKVHMQNDATDATESKQVLREVLVQIITMLHPFMPFVTEEIYQQLDVLREDRDDLLAGSEWDQLGGPVNISESETDWVLLVVGAVRSIKGFLDIPQNESTKIALDFDLSAESAYIVERMAYVEFVDRSDLETVPFVMKPISGKVLYFASDKKEQYAGALSKEMARLEKQIKRDAGRLQSDFREKAPAELVAKTEQTYENNKQSYKALEEEIALNQ